MTFIHFFFLALLLISDTIGAKVDQKEAEKGKGFQTEGKLVYKPQMPYFLLPQFSVVIVRDGKSIGYFSFLVELKASSSENFTKTTMQTQEIVDGIITDLYTFLPVLWVTKSQPATESIKARMWRIINKICGKDAISHIILHQYLWVPQKSPE